jgi:hypothetical protein
MSGFEILHQDDTAGKLICFNRLIFKGHLMSFYQPGAAKFFLHSQGLELKHWASYSRRPALIKAHGQTLAVQAGRLRDTTCSVQQQPSGRR